MSTNLNQLIASVPDTSNNSKNVLTNEVEIEGTLRFGEALIFDGKIKGQIISNGNLTLGKSAIVDGDINVKSLTIYGTVTGNVIVSERCELKSTAQLTGDLKTTRILVEDGATFIGKSDVSPAVKAGKNEDPIRNSNNVLVPPSIVHEPTVRKSAVAN